MHLTSKAKANTMMPSAYRCQMLPKMQMRIHASHTHATFLRHFFCHKRKAPQSAKGLSRSNWKLQFTVGCCEKSMAKRIMPGKPTNTIKVLSSHNKGHFLKCPTMVSATMSTATMMAQTSGVSPSSSLTSACGARR